MRKSDRADSAQSLNELDGCCIEKADTVPKNIALGRNDQKRSLPDGELRDRRDAKQTGRYLSEAVEPFRRKLFGRDPFLARFGNELPLILTDDAIAGRRNAVLVSNAAGFAQKLGHAVCPCAPSMPADLHLMRLSTWRTRRRSIAISEAMGRPQRNPVTGPPTVSSRQVDLVVSITVHPNGSQTAIPLISSSVTAFLVFQA